LFLIVSVEPNWIHMIVGKKSFQPTTNSSRA